MVIALMPVPESAFAEGYNPIDPDKPSFSLPLAGERPAIMRAARRELEGRGFGFTRSNTQAGVLATSSEVLPWRPKGGRHAIGPKDVRCNDDQGNQPDLGADGTTIRVAYNLRVPGGANRATIQAVVDVRGPDGSQLDCVSTGQLESELRGRITGRMQSFGS